MTNAKIEKVLGFYRDLDDGGYSPDARRKPYWHRANFSHFLRGDDFQVRPVTVEYWPSALCNARCPLCPYRRNGARTAADAFSGDTNERSDFFSDVATARHVAAECRRLGVLSVLMTGGGEPFMNPDVAEIAQAFAAQGLAVGIYSNGTVASREKAIQDVADLMPRFVRLSVNAGSADEHRREYSLSSGWHALEQNARLWARVLAPEIPLSFSWVLTGKERPETYQGAAVFLRDLHRATQRGIAGHFRPKYVYYNADGSVHRPKRVDFTGIRQNVDDFVRPALAGDPGVDVQVNTYAIEVSGAAPYPQPSFATGWVTSFTHRGEGYITSELNGSSWPDTCWGTLERGAGGDRTDLEALWFGAERKRLWQLYAREARLPVYHKLTGLSNVLEAIRRLCPEPFTEAEIADFWRLFDAAGYEKPSGWDFI